MPLIHGDTYIWSSKHIQKSHMNYVIITMKWSWVKATTYIKHQSLSTSIARHLNYTQALHHETHSNNHHKCLNIWRNSQLTFLSDNGCFKLYLTNAWYTLHSDVLMIAWRYLNTNALYGRNFLPVCFWNRRLLTIHLYHDNYTIIYTTKNAKIKSKSHFKLTKNTLPIVSNLEQVDRVIKALHCNWSSAKLHLCDLVMVQMSSMHANGPCKANPFRQHDIKITLLLITLNGI